MELSTRIEQWELRKPFTITRGTFTSSEVLVAEIRDEQWLGRAEAAGVDYHGENRQKMVEQMRARLIAICDPSEIDARVKADQRARRQELADSGQLFNEMWKRGYERRSDRLVLRKL